MMSFHERHIMTFNVRWNAQRLALFPKGALPARGSYRTGIWGVIPLYNSQCLQGLFCCFLGFFNTQRSGQVACGCCMQPAYPRSSRTQRPNPGRRQADSLPKSLPSGHSPSQRCGQLAKHSGSDSQTQNAMHGAGLTQGRQLPVS